MIRAQVKLWRMYAGFSLSPRWAFEVWSEHGMLIRDGFAWSRRGAIQKAKAIYRNQDVLDREPEIVDLP